MDNKLDNRKEFETLLKDYSALISTIENAFKKTNFNQEMNEMFYEGVYKAKQFETVIEFILEKME